MSLPIRVGIGGPVGSGKTALAVSLCSKLYPKYEVAVITNDIYTKEKYNCSIIFYITLPPIYDDHVTNIPLFSILFLSP